MNERGPVEVAFGRVEAWLAKHAPVSYRTLKAPASPAEITVAEAGMDVTLPGERGTTRGSTVCTWRRTGGQVGRFSNPPEFWPLPYGTIADYLTAVADCLESGSGPFAEDPYKVPGLAAGCLLWERPGGTVPMAVEWVPLR
ncbi:SMI1/KNR4 family protein [Streptomyces cinereoruber]|uniref:hypothetical protein n=1 Tax=Streptomyces cinereoruber TaxID=67260 RepID=UPI00363EA693